MRLEDLVIKKGNFQGVKSQSSIANIKQLEELLNIDNMAQLGNIMGDIEDKFLFEWTDAEKTKG